MMARRSPSVHLSFLVDGTRREASFPLKPGRHWSRFKAPGAKHVAGAHLYVAQSGRALVCGVRPNNGTLEADGTWQGVFSYSDVVLEARGAGSPVIVLETGEIGTSHTWNETRTFLPRSGFRIRFAVAPTVAEAKAALYLDDLDCELDEYGPTESRLPDVTEHLAGYRQDYGTRYAQSRQTRALLRPKGVPGAPKDGMAPGGDGIFPDGHGYQQCREYVLHSRAAADDWLDRVGPIYLYDSKGRQLGPFSFETPVLPAEVQRGARNTNRDLPPFLEMQRGWGNQEYRRLTPDAGTALWDWQELATSHMIRCVHHAIAAWEYTHDEMLRDDLVALFQARVFLDWQHRPDCPIRPEGVGGYWPDSLTNYLAQAKRHPHNGAPIDRAFAWIGYLGAQCARMGHAGAIDFLRQWVDLVETSHTPDGINNVMHASSYMPGNVQGTQLFHDALIKWAYFAACKQLDRNPLRLLRLWVNRVLDNPALGLLPYKYDTKAVAPPWWIATHIDGQPVRISKENATGCGKPGWSTDYGGSIEHIFPVIAATARAAEDAGDFAAATQVLKIGLNVWIPHSALDVRLNWLASASEKNWKAELQSVLEQRLLVSAMP